MFIVTNKRVPFRVQKTRWEFTLTTNIELTQKDKNRKNESQKEREKNVFQNILFHYFIRFSPHPTQ